MSLPNCFGYNGRLFIRTVLIYIYPVYMYTSVSECNHGTLLDSYLLVLLARHYKTSSCKAVLINLSIYLHFQKGCKSFNLKRRTPSVVLMLFFALTLFEFNYISYDL